MSCAFVVGDVWAASWVATSIVHHPPRFDQFPASPHAMPGHLDRHAARLITRHTGNSLHIALDEHVPSENFGTAPYRSLLRVVGIGLLVVMTNRVLRSQLPNLLTSLIPARQELSLFPALAVIACGSDAHSLTREAARVVSTARRGRRATLRRCRIGDCAPAAVRQRSRSCVARVGRLEQLAQSAADASWRRAGPRRAKGTSAAQGSPCLHKDCSN